MEPGKWRDPPKGRPLQRRSRRRAALSVLALSALAMSTLLIPAAVVSFSSTAHARPAEGTGDVAPRTGTLPPVHLVYERGPGAESCPEEAVAIASMASLLGEGSIQPSAPRALRLSLRRRASTSREIEGHVDLIDERGRRIWEAEQRAGDEDCRTLIASLALSLRVAGARLSPPPPGPEPRESSPKEVIQGVALPPVPFPFGPIFSPTTGPLHPAEEVDALAPSLLLWLAPGPVFGAAPSVPMRISLGVGLRWPGVSLSIEGRSQLPAGGQFRGYRLEVVRWDGAFVPCVDRGIFFACGLLSFGGLWGKITGIRRDSGGWFHASTGARAGVDLTVIGSLGIRTYVDVEGIVVTTGIRMDSYAAWEESPVQVVLGFAVTGTFPAVRLTR